ncbi:hypothetical protein [Clostridium intestinale]|uniref:Flagellar protein FliT n=1 Tax=Clostridium intestinale URNW TaxID=1294142 RepID=U2N7Y2_9CLOT|nr:hypothetical protein [Clostridium intestinale]ERK31612.1 hypothetical protein CINTURNW_0862 [Clostridium intestinale URNW]
MIDFRIEALNIQKEFIILIDKEDFTGIEELIKKRKEFYISYSEHNSKELKEFLNSKEYRDSEIKVNLAFNLLKENVKNEIDRLKASRNASRQYQNNIAHRNGFINKKI